jgi:hypothetical protein
VRVVLYGTAASGPNFFRLFALPQNPANSLTADYVTFSAFNLADASFATNPTLYTTGGALSNYPPPSTLVVCSHANRLFIISAEDGSIWYSKEYVSGEAPGFNDAFQFSVPSAFAPTALASLDDKLFVFTANAIFMVTGSWPTDTGQGLNIAIDRVPSDVGAIDWRSVVVGPDGIYFGSGKGIMLLTRALEVVYVGKDVERWNSYAEITAAFVNPSASEVRFLLNDASQSPRHQELVLNIRNRTQASPHGTWSTFDYSSTAWAGTDMVSAVAFPSLGPGYSSGILKALPSNVLSEGISHADTNLAGGSTWITVIVETATIWPFGRQGFMRCRTATFRGTYKSQHDLRIDLAYNGDAAFAETTTFVDATLAALAREQVSHHLVQQKCSGVRLKLTSAQDGATGEALTLSGIVLEVAQKRGSFDRTMPPEARQ